MITETVKALSIKQPYASLMLHGKIETRTWHTDYRGLVLICASKDPFGLYDIEKISGLRQVERITDLLPGYYQNAPTGKAIAIGRIIQCRPMTKADEDACFVRWRDELWCWVFDEVRPIKPFDWKGQLGLIELGQHIKDKIEYTVRIYGDHRKVDRITRY